MNTGAERFVAALERAGVKVVFGLPGVHNLAAWEALGRSLSIRRVCVRHEQAAVYAADGYARATGETGVALVTTGPGAANTLGAVGEAWASHSPVVVLATDIATSLRRPGIVGGSLHETPDQRALFQTLTKHTVRVTDPAEVGDAVRLARRAPARPVFVEIPTNLLSERAEDWSIDEFTASLLPPQPDVSDAMAQLAGTHRPLIWAGTGALDAEQELTTLAERLGAPVMTTFGARGLMAGHPLNVGLPPHVAEVGAMWKDADVVIAVGTDFDGPSTMNWRLPRPARLIAVNIDELDAVKNYVPDAAVVAESAYVCEQLVRLLPPGTPECWTDLAVLRRRARGQVRGDSPGGVAFIDAFTRAVRGRDELSVVADMCIAGYWLAALHEPPGPRRFQYPIGWGTLGFGFPAAIGAASAGPALAVCGDGGFLMSCGELATVAQEQLPLTTVIVDDGGYGMLRFDQEHAGRAPDGVDLVTPDFVRLAKSFGIRAEKVAGLTDDFARALIEHLDDPKPSVLVAKAALTPPPTVTPLWHLSGPPAWAAGRRAGE